MRRRATITLLTLAVTIAAADARQPAPPRDTPSTRAARVRFDSGPVVRRLPSSESLERFRDDGDFDYGRSYRAPETILDIIRRAIAEWFRRLITADGSSTVWEIVTYVILGLSIVFVTMKMIGVDTRALFFRTKEEGADGAIIEEDIRAIDYPTQIERALAAGDQRLAVRLHYLRLLRDLTGTGAIAWRPDKTDHDYVRELAGSPLRPAFERATLLFAYVWYGDFPIDRASYERIAGVIERARPEVAA